MFFLFLLYVVLLYLIEVVAGSSAEVYNAEVGCDPGCDKVTRLSARQFFAHLLPFVIFSVGVPFSLSFLP